MRAYRELTGLNDVFCFSGWAATLNEGERAFIEHRAPSEEYERQWHIQRAAPELYEALERVNRLIAEAAREGFNYQNGDWAPRLFESQQDTSRALAKARGETP